MNITQILEIFSNSEMIHTLSFSEKMLGVGATITLGMGLTFLVLVVLQYLIVVLTAFMKGKSPDNGKKNEEIKVNKNEVAKEIKEEENPKVLEEEKEELVAAITAALTLKLGKENNFVVTDIVRVIDNAPVWNRTGILEQMTNRI